MRLFPLSFSAFLLSTSLFADNGVAYDIPLLLKSVQTCALGSAFDLVATVTVNHADREPYRRFTVQDAHDAISIKSNIAGLGTRIRPGDIVHVTGFLGEEPELNLDEPTAFCTNLSVIAHGTPPEPIRATALDVANGTFGRKQLRIEGIVTDVCADEIDKHYTLFSLNCEGVTVYAAMRIAYRPEDIRRLIGTRIAVIGHSALHRGRRRLISRYLSIDSFKSITVLESSLDTPPLNVSDLRDGFFSPDEARAVSTRRFAIGRVIAVWSGNKLLLKQADGATVRGELLNPKPPTYGDSIRLVGFPETDLYGIILFHAEWQKEPTGEPPPNENGKANPVSLSQIKMQSDGLLRYDYKFNGEFIALRGIVRSAPTKDGDCCFYLESDGQVITIDTCSIKNSQPQIDIGYEIAVRGICVMETEKIGLARILPRVNGCRLVIRTPNDISIISRPPWWNTTRLAVVMGILLLAMVVIFAWNVILRKAVERRSRALLREQLARIESELKVGERTRLSVELHDTLSQNLLGASMEINTVEQLVSDADALRHLGIASKTLRASRDELRNCLWDLRSQALEEPDMNAAIRKTLEPYVGAIDLQVRFNVPRKLFTDNTAHALMRIIRELVLNAIRHGHAKTVKIAGSRENGQLLFSVRDDGCGFAPSAVPGVGQGHFGLQGVRERLRLLKGTVGIESAPGAGTYVSARFQLPDDETEKI